MFVLSAASNFDLWLFCIQLEDCFSAVSVSFMWLSTNSISEHLSKNVIRCNRLNCYVSLCPPAVTYFQQQQKGKPSSSDVLKTEPMNCSSGDNEFFFFWHLTWASQVAQVIKNPPASAGDAGGTGSIPGSGRSPREGNGNPFQYSCLENPMDRGAWWATFMGSQRVGHAWACKNGQDLLWKFMLFPLRGVKKELRIHRSNLKTRLY